MQVVKKIITNHFMTAFEKGWGVSPGSDWLRFTLCDSTSALKRKDKPGMGYLHVCLVTPRVKPAAEQTTSSVLHPKAM